MRAVSPRFFSFARLINAPTAPCLFRGTNALGISRQHGFDIAPVWVCSATHTTAHKSFWTYLSRFVETTKVKAERQVCAEKEPLDYEALLKSMAQLDKSFGTSGYERAIAGLRKSMAVEFIPMYTTAIIDAARAASSMEETLKLSFQNLGLSSLMDNSLVAKTTMQLATAPLEELQQTGFFKLFPTEPQIKILTEAIATFESRFRLPDLAEAVRLVEPFQVSIAASLARYAVPVPDLKIAIGSIQTPWLDSLKGEHSLKAFAELQGIGNAVRSLPPFDENLAGMLRANLGDFREQITWRPEVLTDLAARADFYATLGFNRELTDFPLHAFEQSLEIAGLNGSLIPTPAAPLAIVEETGLARTNKAHDQLQRFERTLRKFIDNVMTEACGPKWPKQRLPQAIYERWRDKKQKAEQARAEVRPIIEYADFTDYEPLICRSDNWEDVFKVFFKRPEGVRESFQRLYPIRLDTMHARLITQEDELFLRVEIIRLAKLIPK